MEGQLVDCVASEPQQADGRARGWDRIKHGSDVFEDDLRHTGRAEWGQIRVEFREYRCACSRLVAGMPRSQIGERRVHSQLIQQSVDFLEGEFGFELTLDRQSQRDYVASREIAVRVP